MPNLAELSTFLQTILETEYFPSEERGTIYISSVRPIRRMGFALDPWPTLPSWLEHEDLDAIFLHRPQQLDRDTVPPTRGVLYAGAPFDERLTIGFVPRMAEVLGLRGRSPMADKSGRPLGMVGDLPKPVTTAEWRRLVMDMYGGVDEGWENNVQSIRKVAIVNQITPTLVQEAANRGAQAFLTPILRESAQASCRANNMAAFSTGIKRAEHWGLRTLAGMIRERWAGVRTAIFEDRGQ